MIFTRILYNTRMNFNLNVNTTKLRTTSGPPSITLTFESAIIYHNLKIKISRAIILWRTEYLRIQFGKWFNNLISF